VKQTTLKYDSEIHFYFPKSNATERSLISSDKPFEFRKTEKIDKIKLKGQTPPKVEVEYYVI